MNEYLLPIKYENVGCGISVVVAGLEQTYQNYKEIKISIDNENYVLTEINSNIVDFSNTVTFDNLENNRYYLVNAQLVLIDNSIVNINAKILSQIQGATVELSPEMKMKYYLGGGLTTEICPIEVMS